MSKNKIDIAKTVMSQIEAGQIKMKPRILMVVGTTALILGVFGVYILSTFLVSLMSFSLRTHGPMGVARYQELISNFPFWAVGLALAGLVVGIYLMRKFDFSYRNNFILVVLAFVFAILISGWLADYLGLDKIWSGQGQMKKLYQKYDGRGRVLPWRSDEVIIFGRGNGQGSGHGYNGN